MADYGRVAGEMLEVAVEGDASRARVAGEILEVALAKNQARISTLFCEVFLVPRGVDPAPDAGSEGGTRARSQGARLMSVRRKRRSGQGF